MSTLILQQAADSNQWMAIAPELMMALIALVLLVLELVLPKQQQTLIPAIAVVCQAAVLVGLIVNYQSAFIGTAPTFNGLIRHSADGQFLRLYFVVCSMLVCILGMVSLPRQKVPRIEFYHIVIVVSAAMMLLVQANHFVMLFVALETVTVGFYILVSYYRTNALTLEGGLKYLIMGGLSSAILLFGIALLYGVAGSDALQATSADSMNFDRLRSFLSANPGNFTASAGIVLVLCGVAFKIGAVPFQIWIPDVYQGAPTPVTAFLAVASKAAGFGVLLVLTHTVFASYASLVVPVLSVMAGATIIFGNLAALTQHNVKRLIGLSGVAHAGYLLIGVIAAYTQPLAIGAVWFYLVAYLLGSFAVFGVMVHVADATDTDQELEHYAEMIRTRPFLATVLLIALGSLAGIPPLAGFMGKLFIFIAGFQAQLYPLLAIAVAGVVVSIYYYFGWIRAAFFPVSRPSGTETVIAPRQANPVSFGLAAVLVLLSISSLVLGVYQGPLGAWLLAR